MKPIAAVLLMAALARPAGSPPGFHHWTASELNAFSKSLAPKMNAQKVAGQPLGGFGNYSFLMIHREGSGQAEYHETQADVMFFQTGTGTVVYGGKLINPRKTEPHEVRAPSIEGGMEVKVAPGDVLTIPPKTPHQVKLEPGREISYLTVKVTQ